MNEEQPLPGLYRMECEVMPYDWGGRGDQAYLHRLLRASGRGGDPNIPAAELWMGAHPRAPARVLAEGASLARTTAGSAGPRSWQGDRPEGLRLDALIRERPHHTLGSDLVRQGVRTLPFLFKVLDAARPLSIQAHPDRALARQLHARDPDNYPDDNHKPELAVCIQGMEALMGFRTAEEIAERLRWFPEMAALASPHGALFAGETEPAPPPQDPAGKRAWIRERYGHLMRSSPHEIGEAVRCHRLRLESFASEESLRSEDRLFARLVRLYGERDPGLFSAYFLNYVQLAPGEALFLGANEPHAYLGGAILECMAASDNVVRAGLTSKFVDVATLVAMLTYAGGAPRILRPELLDANEPRIERYATPAPEFEVRRLRPGGRPLIVQPEGPATLLSLSGGFQAALLPADAAEGLQGRERPDGEGEAVERLHLPPGAPLFLPGDLRSRGLALRLSAGEGTIVFQALCGAELR